MSHHGSPFLGRGLPTVIAFSVLACGLVLMNCAESPSPAAPSRSAAMGATSLTHEGHVVSAKSQSEEKGYIKGWFEGEEVELYYTKSYFCSEPPSSGAPTDCEIGAPAEVEPKPGRIRTIYAIAPAGFQPDPSTLSCLAGSPCLNHPGMIDASRIGRGSSIPAVSHSHILDERGGGWRHTVNIRVFSPSAWNEIVAAKSLAKVRELQGDPAVGTPGVISADTPTNIYFFIASWR